jgi:hypothetical protein
MFDGEKQIELRASKAKIAIAAGTIHFASPTEAPLSSFLLAAPIIVVKKGAREFTEVKNE